jgi:hypothetical protein
MNLADLVGWADKKDFDCINLGLPGRPLSFSRGEESYDPDFKFSQNDAEDIISELLDEESYSELVESGYMEGASGLGESTKIYFKFYMSGGAVNLFLHLAKPKLAEFKNIKQFSSFLLNSTSTHRYVHIGCSEDNSMRYSLLIILNKLADTGKKAVIVDFEKGRYTSDINKNNPSNYTVDLDYGDDAGMGNLIISERYFRDFEVIIVADAPKLKAINPRVTLISGGIDSYNSLPAIYPSSLNAVDCLISISTVSIRNNNFLIYGHRSSDGLEFTYDYPMERSLAEVCSDYQLQLPEAKRVIDSRGMDYSKFLKSA